MDSPVIAVALLLAINDANFPDLIEIDAASNKSIDEIRNLKENKL